MNIGRRGWRTAIRGTASAFAVTVALAAAEDTAPARQEDAIVAAKRDYAAIKAATAGVEQQNLALPKTALPSIELKTGREEAVVPLRQLGPADRKEQDRLRQAGRSPNWLLDAMADNKKDDAAEISPGTSDSSRLVANGDANSKGDFLANSAALMREQEAKASESEKAKRTQPENQPADAANPLSRYMTAWMSARDLELLTPSKETAAPGVGVASAPIASGGVAAVSLDAIAPADASGGRISDFADAGPSAATAPANPYLSDLTTLPAVSSFASSPAATAFELPPEPASPPPASTLAPAPEQSAPSGTDASLNDLIKSRDDEKYFKPLKRF